MELKEYLESRITELIKLKQSQPDDEFRDRIINDCNAVLTELIYIFDEFFKENYFEFYDQKGNKIR